MKNAEQKKTPRRSKRQGARETELLPMVAEPAPQVKSAPTDDEVALHDAIDFGVYVKCEQITKLEPEQGNAMRLLRLAYRHARKLTRTEAA